MKRFDLLLISVLGVVAAACGGAPDDTAEATAGDALTNASPTYYVLSRVNGTKNKGDAFIAPAIGGTMTCAGGNVASSCLATFDASALAGPDGALLAADEASAAKAAFLAGKLVVRGTFGKSGNTLAVTRAWSSVGAPAPSTAKLWLVTPSAGAFKDVELGSGAVRHATTIDLSRLALTPDVETKTRASVSTSGAIVRGTHHGSGAAVTLGAEVVFTPVVHAAAPPAGLTADEEATALHDIDSKCGDTWCTGDYNFRFDALKCDFVSGACTLTLAVTYPNDGSPDAKWLPGSCALAGYHAFADLVTVQTPVYSTITATLDDAMFACTQAVEATVPK